MQEDWKPKLVKEELDSAASTEKAVETPTEQKIEVETTQESINPPGRVGSTLNNLQGQGGGMIPYEQEKIILHLESLIEDERLTGIDIKENLKKLLNEKRDDLQFHHNRNEELKQQSDLLENENNSLKTDFKNLENEFRDF